MVLQVLNIEGYACYVYNPLTLTLLYYQKEITEYKLNYNGMDFSFKRWHHLPLRH